MSMAWPRRFRRVCRNLSGSPAGSAGICPVLPQGLPESVRSPPEGREPSQRREERRAEGVVGGGLGAPDGALGDAEVLGGRGLGPALGLAPGPQLPAGADRGGRRQLVGPKTV